MTASRGDLLAALAEMSEAYPSLRFGQMIANLADAAKRPSTQGQAAEAVWDVEDGELLREARESVDRRLLSREGQHEPDPAR